MVMLERRMEEKRPLDVDERFEEWNLRFERLGVHINEIKVNDDHVPFITQY
jgi:hypothetical protein